MSVTLENLKDVVVVKYTEIDTALMQLFEWLPEYELPWLIKERHRILQGKNRIAVLVNRGAQYSLFVNKVADIV